MRTSVTAGPRAQIADPHPRRFRSSAIWASPRQPRQAAVVRGANMHVCRTFALQQPEMHPSQQLATPHPSFVAYSSEEDHPAKAAERGRAGAPCRVPPCASRDHRHLRRPSILTRRHNAHWPSRAPRAPSYVPGCPCAGQQEVQCQFEQIHCQCWRRVTQTSFASAATPVGA